MPNQPGRLYQGEYSNTDSPQMRSLNDDEQWKTNKFKTM